MLAAVDGPVKHYKGLYALRGKCYTLGYAGNDPRLQERPATFPLGRNDLIP